MQNDNLCTMYLVRHGQTESNRDQILMGHQDAPLTEEGILQAQKTGEVLKDIHFDAIFSSDLGRAHRTAEILRLERDLVIKTTNALRERNYGQWEGKNIEEFRKNFKEIYEKFRDAPYEERIKYRPTEDVESDEELNTRVITFLREMAVAYAGKTVLVVSSGGCLRTLLIHLGYFTYKNIPSGAVENAGYIKLKSDGVDFFVEEVSGVKNRLF